MSIGRKKTSMLEPFAANRTALIIVDMQNDYIHEEGAHARAGAVYHPAVDGVLKNIGRLVDTARRHGALPVYVMTTHDSTTDSEAWLQRKDGLGVPHSQVSRTGTWGSALFEMEPEDGDIVVTKHRYSAFVGTNLDLVLRSHDIRSLVLTGVATNVCVDCTLRDGLQLDYHVALVSDASSATSEKAWEDTVESTARNYGPVCLTEEIIMRWEHS